MPDNLKVGPNVVIPKENRSFVASGFTTVNCQRVFRVFDNSLKSWTPGQTINGISGFEVGDWGYYIIMKQAMDLSAFLLPPIQDLVSYNAESNAYFSRVVTAGGSLTNDDKTGIDNFVSFLKTDAVGEGVTYLSKLIEFYFFAGETLGSLPLGLKDAHNGTLVGTVFPSGGFLSNGTTGYMNTGIDASLVFALGNSAVSIDSLSNTVGDFSDIGIYDATNDSFILRLKTAAGEGESVMYATAQKAVAANADSSGQYVASYKSGNLHILKGNTILAGAVAPSGTLPIGNIFVGALNNIAFSLVGQFSNRKYRSVGFFTGLTDAQAFALNAQLLILRNAMS